MIAKHSLIALAALALAGPAAAQDYSTTTNTSKHGNGYGPSNIVAGWRRPFDFTVLAIAPEGDRVSASGLVTQWKATLIVGPNPIPEDEEVEDERYLNTEPAAPRRAEDDDEAAAQARRTPRTERVYTSLTCPSILPRMQALAPFTSFEFNPPSLAGNMDGPLGNGDHELDLWIRIGGGEISKSAGVPESALGRWLQETLRMLEACPTPGGVGVNRNKSGQSLFFAYCKSAIGLRKRVTVPIYSRKPG